jgi:KDO2-lipid IV(A) lauroyltransferase
MGYLSIEIFMTSPALTKKKGESYSTHLGGDITMMSKEWRRRLNSFFERLNFILAPPIMLLIKLIPLSGIYFAGWVLARLINLLPSSRRRVAFANLRLVFGKRKTEDEIQAIYKECLTRSTTSLLELMKFRFLPLPVARQRIDVVGAENLDAALKNGKGVIIPGLHLGNFPLFPAILAKRGYPIAVIIKKPRNRYLAQLYTMMEDIGGVRLIDSRDRKLAAEQSLQQLREGGIIYIVMDQNPPYPDIVVDFFGYSVPSFKGPVVLAMRTGATVLPAYIVYEDGWRHKVIIEKPLPLEITGDNKRDVVHNLARLMKLFEGYIEQYPGQWWWWHRRWRSHIDYKQLQHRR